MLDDYVSEKVMNIWNVIIEVRMLRKLYKLHDTLEHHCVWVISAALQESFVRIKYFHSLNTSSVFIVLDVTILLY